jgi:tetratricopeptide (TPR) repeat protein
MGCRPCSEGYISQRLKYYGLKVSPTLKSETIQFVLFLSDEIFANNWPILITIEPQSTTILRIELADDRTSKTWQEHWIEIERNHYYTLGLVSDRGKGLVEGFKESFEGLPYYPDHFHEFRELAQIILVELEKKAYSAIEYEDERYRVLDSARSKWLINNRIEDYEEAVEATKKAIEMYEWHVYLFRCIQENLELFDKEGKLKNVDFVKGEIITSLELMDELAYTKVTDIVKKLKERADEFLLYFGRAVEVYKNLSDRLKNEEMLSGLCLAWQWDHKVHQARTGKQKDFFKKERDFWLGYGEGLLGEDIQNLQEEVFCQLDTIVRSSSLVEMVNSLIRPYLNTCKDQITQETLNLIMFYHNHRRYNDGKRKNKAPLEILTGRELKKHWVDLLLDYDNSQIDDKSESEKIIFTSETIEEALTVAL